MPFISEELWQRIPRRSDAAVSIMIADYPEPELVSLIPVNRLFEQYPYRNEGLESEVNFASDIVKTVRSLRSDYDLTNKNKADCKLKIQNCYNF